MGIDFSILRTHFKRENGSIFNPFENLPRGEESWHQFPLTVHIIRMFYFFSFWPKNISVTPSKIETVNTLSDAHNGMDSDYCLCVVDDLTALFAFFKSRPNFLLFCYFILGIMIIASLTVITLKFSSN